MVYQMKKLQQFPIRIRRAVDGDISYISKIARQYPQELGFVSNVRLRDGISRKGLLVAEYGGTLAGFVLYRQRKDGWHTIYEIGVDKNYRGKGVGRFLVDAVPCPTRLKCTVDNSANEFYKKSHFYLVRTEEGRKRKLNVWERKFLYILCKGSSRFACELSDEFNSIYGTRDAEIPYKQPFFVDIRWKEYDWLEYLMKIRAWKPVFAMVPDFTDISQRRSLYSKIDDLKQAGVLRIGVCPKFDGAIKYVPLSCVICVSIPSRYAGFLPKIEELKGRQIHLLGGSPGKQFKYIQEHPTLRVISGDFNSYIKAAEFGTFYNSETNNWKNIKKLKSYKEWSRYSLEQIYETLRKAHA